MGAFASSRQNVAVEENEQNSSNNYKYPPRSGGNYFGTHFIMGGERFDTPQPESYLFGENSDLNLLGNRPTAFPYPPPQENEPTKTLKSLVNIRKESVRFIRLPPEKGQRDSIISRSGEQVDGNILGSAGVGVGTITGGGGGVGGNGGGGSTGIGGGGGCGDGPSCSYNIEFTFDSDAKCAITIYYFCTEAITPRGVTLVPRDGLISETYHYEKGINQFFSQPTHVFNPQLIPEDDLLYNPSKEQYPVAIHCVVEEGNEDARQSHTTICVIDHHAETSSYVLRALKQKIFVDGLSYLLQEIYGIENKAVNKSSIDDEEIDDHGSECVICMSETRDTLILPCRHLCLCNSCADSLRYQANNCPICRAPFRALLQIRAVQKGVSTHALHQNAPTGEAAPCDQQLPAGYIPVSLIEALNGPPQFIGKVKSNDGDMTDGNILAGGEKTTSPLKPNSGQRRTKSKKSVSTSTNTNNELPSAANANAAPTVVEITNEINNGGNNGGGSSATGHKKSSSLSNSEKLDKCATIPPRAMQDKLQIVNERHSLKIPKSKRSTSNSIAAAAHSVDADEDSENEKLSPLLSPNRCKSGVPTITKTLTMDDVNAPIDSDAERHNDDDEDVHFGSMNKSSGGGSGNNGNGGGGAGAASGGGGGDGEEMQMKIASSTSLKKQKRPDLSASQHETIGHSSHGGSAIARPTLNAAATGDDSDYYTPEDTQNSILSPLCPDRAKSGDKLSGLKSTAGSFKSANSLVKKSLHKKSTSVGNIVGPGNGGSGGGGVGTGNTASDLKGNVSSLPDMLDSPISTAGNTASTRSSSDSYSSSSSTKQLLSSNPTTSNAANIIVDDKTALQNAVNV